ncbi:hypothetical protein D3C78_614100 [compost metagenome]
MKQQYVAAPRASVPVKAGQSFSLSNVKNPGQVDMYRALIDFDMIVEAQKAGIDLFSEPGSATDQARVALVLAGHLVTNGIAEIDASKNKQIH